VDSKKSNILFTPVVRELSIFIWKERNLRLFFEEEEEEEEEQGRVQILRVVEEIVLDVRLSQTLFFLLVFVFRLLLLSLVQLLLFSG
jgi:hypothetical protein